MTSIALRASLLATLFVLAPCLYAEPAPAGMPMTFKNATYYDTAKKEITQAEFDQRVKAGAQFSMRKLMVEGEEPIVKMSLQKAGDTPSFASPRYKIAPGASFPAFSLPRLIGKPIDNKVLMGKYTIVSFYFAGCAPCIAEIPELNAFSEGREDMNFIGMTFDPVPVTRKFVEQHKLTWTLLSDATKTLDVLGVKHFPAFALIDPQGKLVAIEPGHAIQARDKGIAAWVQRLVPARDQARAAQ